VTLSLAPVIIKSRIGAGIEVETAINLFFAIGIAIGSLLAAMLAHGRIWLAPAPFFLLVMAAFTIDLGLTAGALPQAASEVGLADFFTSAVGVHIVVDILGLSVAAGLFVVPIFAAVQAWAGEDRRARVVGAVNTLNAFYMVAGSLATTLLLKVAGLSEPAVLTILGCANILAAIYVFMRLPRRLEPEAAPATA
jgi:acyl-[acyl-carrier-protein]-phospholipid O-acyltransferase / long-chain-fatty-acid--[acyl-carrier-protein] ligase